MHIQKQQGVVLIISLILLVALTLVGLATIRSSTTNVQLVSNSELQMEAEAVAINSLNYLVSDLDYYVSPADYTTGGAYSVDIPAAISKGYTVTIVQNECLGSKTTPGDSISIKGGSSAGASTSDYYWEIGVASTDPVSGVSSTYTTGIKFEYLAGFCTSII